jgi:hypothetical protein
VPSNGRSREISSHDRQPWEVVADLDGHRARDAVGPQQQDVERMTALPLQALLGVVGRPHVVRREAVDRARVGDRPVRGDLRPAADADAVGLADPAVAGQGLDGGVAVRPDALLERPTQLGLMRRPHDVVALVLERGVQEEALVLELEVLALLADPALAQRDELLALGQRADRSRPIP